MADCIVWHFVQVPLSLFMFNLFIRLRVISTHYDIICTQHSTLLSFTFAKDYPNPPTHKALSSSVRLCLIVHRLEPHSPLYGSHQERESVFLECTVYIVCTIRVLLTCSGTFIFDIHLAEPWGIRLLTVWINCCKALLTETTYPSSVHWLSVCNRLENGVWLIQLHSCISISYHYFTLTVHSRYTHRLYSFFLTPHF